MGLLLETVKVSLKGFHGDKISREMVKGNLHELVQKEKIGSRQRDSYRYSDTFSQSEYRVICTK